jgi:hypothetical protein
MDAWNWPGSSAAQILRRWNGLGRRARAGQPAARRPPDHLTRWPAFVAGGNEASAVVPGQARPGNSSRQSKMRARGRPRHRTGASPHRTKIFAAWHGRRRVCGTHPGPGDVMAGVHGAGLMACACGRGETGKPAQQPFAANGRPWRNGAELRGERVTAVNSQAVTVPRAAAPATGAGQT